VVTTPDGSRIALAAGGVVDVYETQTGRLLDHFPDPSNHEAVDFSRDRRLLAIGRGHSAVIRDVTAARVVWKLSGHRDSVVAICFSPDQKMIATASWDHTARLWDAATGKSLAVLTSHKAAVKSCAFSPDGRTLVTGSDDRTIKFWNLATLRQIASIQLNYPVRFLAFSPDGQILVANNADNSLCCWRVPSLTEIDAAEAKEMTESKPR
jgi:WD40 repeat protein